jgi:cephalosporin-C deacetylase-like acetyl esterase
MSVRCLLALCALVLFQGVFAVMPASDPVYLQSHAQGGWETVGLPYAARIAASGHLESLTANGFEFLAPSDKPVHGLYLANGDTPQPFAGARVEGNTLLLQLPNDGWARLRFDAAGIHVTAFNTTPESFPLRLELNNGVARVKSPTTGVEEVLPVKLTSGKVRLIAPGGASLTLPGEYVYPAGKGYLAKLPYISPLGIETNFDITVAPQPLVEDQVKVACKGATQDFAYWGDGPQPFTTELTNMLPDAVFRGKVELTLVNYLTRAKTVLSQPLILGAKAMKPLAWTLSGLEPGVYIAEVRVQRQGQTGLCCSPRLVFNAGAIQPPPTPADFDAFWQKTLDEQAKIPLDLQITKVKEQGQHEIYKFNFAGLLGYRCYGYLTLPKDKSKKYPAVLVLPSSGMHGLNPPVQAGVVGMAININTVDVDLPEYDWRTWPAPYLVTGILQREYYSLRFSYAACARAAEVLAARPEVDANDILVTGGSQGGGLALIAAGLYPKFKACLANVPGLCRLDWNFDIIHPEYFPIGATESGKPMIRRTLLYYDAAYFARRIQCPTWVSVGLLDDVTPALDAICVFNAIPAKKQLMVQPFTGHGGGFSQDALKGVWP